MAFVSEEIITEEDKVYFNSIGFTQLATGEKVRPFWWVIDRAKGIIMTCRGGIFAEPTEGYQIYIEKEFVNIELVERGSGDYFKKNVTAYYIIQKVEIPKQLIDKGVTVEQIKDLINVMFRTAGSFGHDPEKTKEITITMEAEPIIV